VVAACPLAHRRSSRPLRGRSALPTGSTTTNFNFFERHAAALSHARSGLGRVAMTVRARSTAATSLNDASFSWPQTSAKDLFRERQGQYEVQRVQSRCGLQSECSPRAHQDVSCRPRSNEWPLGDPACCRPSSSLRLLVLTKKRLWVVAFG